MSPVSHITFCTSTKSNLYLDNSLTTLVSEPDLYRFLTFQVPNHISFFQCLGHKKVSVQDRGRCIPFVKRSVFTVRSYHLAQPPSWRTTSFRLSVTCLFNIFAATLYTLEAVPPSATWGCAMPWWQGPTYHGRTNEAIQGKVYKTLAVLFLLHVEKHTLMFLKKCIAN